MRRCTGIALFVLAGIGALAASGFPRRIGLTVSQAAVSLPGDLLVPRADVVVDRAVRINAPVETVWHVLDAAFEEDQSDRVIARTSNASLIVRVRMPGAGDEEDARGTCVFALLDLPNGRTLLHMRERHESNPQDAPRAVICAGLALESFSTMRMLGDIKHASEAAARFTRREAPECG